MWQNKGTVMPEWQLKIHQIIGFSSRQNKLCYLVVSVTTTWWISKYVERFVLFHRESRLKHLQLLKQDIGELTGVWSRQVQGVVLIRDSLDQLVSSLAQGNDAGAILTVTVSSSPAYEWFQLWFHKGRPAYNLRMAVGYPWLSPTIMLTSVV